MKILILIILIKYIIIIKGQTFPNIADVSNFHSKVDYRSNVNSKSAYIEEYYNFVTGRGRLDIIANGSQTTYIYENATKQILQFTPNKCTVYDDLLNNAPKLFDNFYGWIDKDPNGFLLIGPSALLRQVKNLAKQLTITLNNTMVSIRRIPCQQFTVTGSAFGSNKLIFYFAGDTWNTLEDNRRFKQIPVRLTIASSDLSLTVDYDYFLFEEYNKTWDEFLPQIGLGCNGKKSIKQLPLIGNSFSVDIEIIYVNLLQGVNSTSDSIKNYIMKTNVIYDGVMKLVKVVYSDPETDDNADIIMDFNYGISYTLREGKPCLIKHIEQSVLTKESNALSFLKTAKELLLWSNDTYYLGKTFKRGIFCDVWERVMLNTSLFDDSQSTNFTYAKIVVTSYILDNNSMEYTDEKNTDVPIQTLMTVYYKDGDAPLFQVEINFFSFKNDLNDFSDIIDAFDVKDCFPSSYSRSYMELFIPAIRLDNWIVQRYLKEFRKSLTLEVSFGAQISILRIPVVEIDFGENGVMANVMILDKEPFSLSFKKMNTTNSQSFQNEQQVKVKSDEECADKTLELQAKSFRWCSDKTCFINTKGSTNQNKVDPNINCSSYSLDADNSTTNMILDSKNLSQALVNLMTAINKKQLSFGLFMEDREGRGRREVTFNITNYVISEQIVYDVYSNSLYNLIFSGSVLNAEPTIQANPSSGNPLRDIGDCYIACRAEADLDCLSFSFCNNIDNSISCYLSSQLVYEDMKNKTAVVKVNTQCNTYAISYLYGYTKVDGQEVIASSDKNTEANTANLCAQLCDLNTDFACKSFQYCESMECFLRKQHFLDFSIKSNDIKAGHDSTLTNCVFYTVKYLADYKDSGWNLVKDNNAVKFSGESAESCAKHCSSDVENCTSFNYCPGNSKDVEQDRSYCELSSHSIYDANTQTYTTSLCRHYERSASSRTAITPVHSLTNQNPNLGGMTSEGFYGLIFSLLICGAVLGVIGYFGAQYYRQHADNDSSGFRIKFLRQSDD